MDVFVSYASGDAAVANAVVGVLEQAGVSCWIAPRNIPAGVAYGDGIMAGLRSCRVFVVVVSARAIASPQVLREVERAVHHGLVLVPFRIDDSQLTGSFEFFLSLPHWIDGARPPIAPHLEHLRESVQRILGTPIVSPARARNETSSEPHVEEISPDQWSARRPGPLRQFLTRLLRDPESPDSPPNAENPRHQEGR